ncbi:hypothetical protein [Arthrobacter sp. 2MCAF14]|uniref:hypothetical protein n=1 Tax=Arthrobacter sp. 2MCAF14 TaxID=3232982 RepID=UPI003F8F1906
MANLAEILINESPDVMGDAGLYDGEGPDLMYVSGILIKPAFRGSTLGYTILDTIIRTIGRACPLVIVQAAPILEDDGLEAPRSAWGPCRIRASKE